MCGRRPAVRPGFAAVACGAAIVAAVQLLGPLSAFGTAPPGQPRLTGRVLDRAGVPRSGVRIDLLGGSITPTHTDAAGIYRIALPLPGGFRLRASFPGGERFETRPFAAIHDAALPDLDPRSKDPFWIAGASRGGRGPVEQPWPVAGRLVDAGSGQPIAGAWIASDREVGRSAADGRFRLTSSARSLDIAAEGYVASVRAPSPRIGLEAAIRLQGTVVDPAGRPLAGARVIATPTPGLVALRPAAWTDEAGRFRLSNIEHGVRLRLSADRPGHADARTVVVAGDDPPVRLVLTPTGPTHGTVVDRTERPIAGATVILTGDPKASLRRQAETDSAGRFALADVPDGRYRLSVRARGFRSAEIFGVERPAGSGDADLGTVILDPGARLGGVVLDPDQQPVEGATVVAVRGSKIEAEAITDSAGSFMLLGLADDARLRVEATHPAWAPAWRDGVVPGDGLGLSLRLEPSAVLTGSVVAGNDQPVAGARLRVQAERATTAGVTIDAVTDPDGRFRITGLGAGKHRLRVTAEPLAARDLALDLAAGDKTEMVITLTRPGALHGQVRDARKAAVEGAWIALEPVDRSGNPLRGLSDTEGRFRIDGVPPGPYRAVAWHPDHPQVETLIDIVAGRRASLELVLAEAPTGRLEGIVIGEEGQSVSARVVLRATRSRRVLETIAETGIGGHFAFDALADGVYRVDAHAAGHAAGHVTSAVEAADEPTFLRLELAAESVVEGVLLGASQDDLPRIVLEARGPEQARRQGTLRYDGSFLITGLAAGTWRIDARLGAGGPQDSAEVELGIGDHAEIILDLGRGHRLAGRIQARGRPVSGASIDVVGADGLWRSASDSDGRFLIDGIRAGRHELRIHTADGRMAHREELSIEGDRQVEIALRRAALAGRVLASVTREPVADAAVSLESSPSPQARRARTDADGSYRFDDVEAGAHRLRVGKDGWSESQEHVALSDGEHTLDVILEPADEVLVAVHRQDGGRLTLVDVVARDAAGRQTAAGRYPVDSGGRWRMPAPRSGIWQLLVSAPGTATATATVEAGAPTAALSLPAPGAISARVAELDPDSGILVMVQASSGGRFVQVGSGGTAIDTFSGVAAGVAVSGLPPGPVQIIAVTGDGRRYAAAAWVEAASTTPVDLTVTSSP